MEIQTIYPARCSGGIKSGTIVAAEEKIDGHRGLLHIGTDLDRGYLTSRSDSVKTGKPGENGFNVPQIAEWAQKTAERKGWEYTVLDGEVIVPGYKFEEVQTVMGSLPEQAVFWQQHHEKAVFMAFDVLIFAGIDIRGWSYRTRKDALKRLVPAILQDTPYVQYVQEEYRTDHAAFFRSVVDRGGEGLVLKDPDAIYGRGWVKWKKEYTYDVVVTGFTKGGGKFRDLFGAVQFGLYEGPDSFRGVGQCSGMPDGNCRWVNDAGDPVAPNLKGCKLVPLDYDPDNQPEGSRAWFHLNKDKLLGSVIEVKGNGLTRHGRIRHPQFVRIRPDKSAVDCTALTE